MELVPIARWLAVVAALGAVGAPAAAWLLPDTPDGGAGFALPVSLFALGLVGYYAGRIDAALALPAGALAAASLGAVAWRRGARPLRPRRLLAPVLAFAGAFVLLLLVRATDPAIVPQGGEKFLDYSLLRSLLRAPAYPPEDPWFAGEAVRYYYGGPLLASLLTRAAGVDPAVAYNLVLPTFFGTIAAAAYSLAAAVADRAPAVAGWAAAALAVLGGTLATPGRALLGLLPRPVASEWGRAFTQGIRASHTDALDAARFLASDAQYGYWIGRYVIPDVPTVTPAWAFLNGDMRSHMLGPPFLLLAVAVCYAARSAGRRRRAALLFGVLPAVAGWIALVNTWSFPAVLGVAWLALSFAPADPADLLPAALGDRLPGGELARPFVALVPTAGVAALSVAWAAPYLLSRTATNRGIGLFPPRSPIDGLLLTYGGLAVPLALALAAALAPGARRRWEYGTGAAAVAVGVVVVAAAALVAGFRLGGLVLFGPLVVGAWLARRRERVGFLGVLVAAGAGIALGVEFLNARVWPYDPNAPRWNTYYKAFGQTWLLWSVAAGASLSALVARARDAPRSLRRVAPAALAALLLVSSLSLGALGAGAALADSDPASGSLNGTAWIDRWHAGEAPAIRWLDGREGRPVIVSKPGTALYSWVNAPSTFTGLPTVVGWKHQAGYRGMDAFEQRRRHVETIYEGEWTRARDLLLRYDVRYVYVGPNEQVAYDVRAFAAHEGVSVAYEAPRATVYAVNQSALS